MLVSKTGNVDALADFFSAKNPLIPLEYLRSDSLLCLLISFFSYIYYMIRYVWVDGVTM